MCKDIVIIMQYRFICFLIMMDLYVTLPKPGLVSLFYRPISGTFLDYTITMYYSAMAMYRLAGNVLGQVSKQAIDNNQ